MGDMDLPVGFIIWLAFLSSLLPTIILSIVITKAIKTYRRTEKWDKARKQTPIELEATLLPASEEEQDFLDSEDEREYNERKDEDERDRLHLTFRQKWYKEFKTATNNDKAKREAKRKEKEERRLMARAVARELERERRRGGDVVEETLDADELPPYRKD